MISYLQIDKLTKSFGDLVLFEDITFGIAQGQKVGLIAKNGTGKTTLLNIIAGKEDYDSGAVVFRNDLRVGYLEQMPHYPDGLTVLQACFYSPNETVRLIAEYEQAMASGDHSNLEDILLRMDNLKAWDYEQRTKQILGQLKIHNFDQKVETLSGGQLKRVALANVLITDPELIILDEPTNHLDNDMVLWLEDYLRAWKGALVMVTHDRYFLERIVGRMAEVEDGRLFTHEGNYDKYLERKAARLESERASERKRQAILRREYQWVMQGPYRPGDQEPGAAGALRGPEGRVYHHSGKAAHPAALQGHAEAVRLLAGPVLPAGHPGAGRAGGRPGPGDAAAGVVPADGRRGRPRHHSAGILPQPAGAGGRVRPCGHSLQGEGAH